MKVKHECHVCGEAFSWPSRLQQHMTVHTGDKPYRCQVCDKACSHSSTLKKHMKTVHGGEKSHICQTCGKAFCWVLAYRIGVTCVTRHLVSLIICKPTLESTQETKHRSIRCVTTDKASRQFSTLKSSFILFVAPLYRPINVYIKVLCLRKLL